MKMKATSLDPSSPIYEEEEGASKVALISI